MKSLLRIGFLIHLLHYSQSNYYVPLQKCENNFVLDGDDCIYSTIQGEEKNFLDAKLDCEQKYSSLIIIQSTDDNKKLTRTYKNYLGIEYHAEEQKYYWIDGTSIDSPLWPSTVIKNRCVILTDKATWDFVDCNDKFAYSCRSSSYLWKENDDISNTFIHTIQIDDKMTIQKCMECCSLILESDIFNMVLGLMKGNMCMCGINNNKVSLTGLKQFPLFQKVMPCSGNKLEKCGNDEAITVYTTYIPKIHFQKLPENIDIDGNEVEISIGEKIGVSVHFNGSDKCDSAANLCKTSSLGIIPPDIKIYYGDDNKGQEWTSNNNSSIFQNVFYLDGNFESSVQIIDQKNSITIFRNILIKVLNPQKKYLLENNLTCPNHTNLGEYFPCSVYSNSLLKQNSNVSIMDKRSNTEDFKVQSIDIPESFKLKSSTFPCISKSVKYTNTGVAYILRNSFLKIVPRYLSIQVFAKSTGDLILDILKPKCSFGEIWCSLKKSCVTTCCSEKPFQNIWDKCSIFLLNSGQCEKSDPCIKGTSTSKPVKFEATELTKLSITKDLVNRNYQFFIKFEIEITEIHLFGLRCPATGTCATIMTVDVNSEDGEYVGDYDASSKTYIPVYSLKSAKQIEMTIIGMETDKLQIEQQFFCDKPSLKNVELLISDGLVASPKSSNFEIHCHQKVETVSEIVPEPIKHMNITLSNSSMYQVDMMLSNGNAHDFKVELHTDGSYTQIEWGVSSKGQCKPIERDEGQASVSLKNNIPYLSKSSSYLNVCKFPFYYDGAIYYGCIEIEDNSGSPAYLCPEAVGYLFRALNLIRCNDHCHIHKTPEIGAGTETFIPKNVNATSGYSSFYKTTYNRLVDTIILVYTIDFSSYDPGETYTLTLTAKDNLNNNSLIKTMTWNIFLMQQVNLNNWSLFYNEYQKKNDVFTLKLSPDPNMFLPTALSLKIHPISGTRINGSRMVIDKSTCIPFIYVENDSDRQPPFCEDEACVESFTFSKMGIKTGVLKSASDGSMGLYGPYLEIVIPSFYDSIGVFGFSIVLFNLDVNETIIPQENITVLDPLPEGSGKMIDVISNKMEINFVERFQEIEGPIAVNIQYANLNKFNGATRDSEYKKLKFYIPQFSIPKLTLKVVAGNVRRIQYNITSSRHSLENYICQKDWPNGTFDGILSWEIGNCDILPIGEYEVILSAWNPISGWIHSKTATIAVIMDITPIVIEDFSILNDKNEKKVFNIQLGGITETVCVTIDFGDGSKINYFGNVLTCMDKYTSIKSDEVVSLDTSTNNFNVTHTYSMRSIFNMRAYAFDGSSETENAIKVPIFLVGCEMPILSIPVNATTIFHDVPKYSRSSSFSISSSASIFCTEKTPTFFEWTAHLMSEIENVGAREISIVVLNETISSWNLSTINVPKRFLKPGLYRFTLKFGIKLQDDFKKYHNIYKEAHVLIRIKSSPLEAILIQGSPKEIKRGWSQIVNLNPLDLSLDPDEPEETKFNFTWFCKVSTEKYRNTDEEDFPHYNSSLAFPIPPARAQAIVFDTPPGCFGNGPGPLSFTGGVLNLNTSSFVTYGKTYEILLILSKVSESIFKRTKVVLSISVVFPSIPIPSVMCTFPDLCIFHSGKIFIDPKMRLVFNGACKAECNGKERYQWNILLPNPHVLNEIYCEDSLKKDCKWIYGDGTNNATNSRSLVLRKEFFTHLPKTILSFQVKLSITEEKIDISNERQEVTGEIAMELFINQPPTGGSCQVGFLNSGVFTPTNIGKGLVEDYEIRCNDFKDPDSHRIIRYTMIIEQLSDNSTYSILYTGPSISASVIFPVGDFHVYVKVYDELEAYSLMDASLDFKVNLPTESEYKEFEISKKLEYLNSVGDTTKINQILSADASIRSRACWFNITCKLASNKMDIQNLTESGQKVLNEMILNITKSNSDSLKNLKDGLNINDINQVTQASSTLYSITKTISTDPLLRKTLDMEARETTVNILETLSGALTNADVKNPLDLQAIIDNTAGTATILLDSLKEILYNNDPDDIPISDRMNAEYMPYDTDIPEDDADIPDDPDDALKQNALKLTRIHSIKQVKKISSIINDVGQSLVSKLIPGESLKSSSSIGFQMIISKFDASNLIGKDTDGDGIPDTKLRFEFDNNPSVVQFPLGFCPNKNIRGMISYKCRGVFSIVTKSWNTITMIYPISAQRLHPRTRQIDVNVYDGNDNEILIDKISRDIELIIDREVSEDLSLNENFVHVDVSSKLESFDNKLPIIYHQFNISHPYSTLNLEMKASDINDNSSIVILFGYEFLPTLKKCDFLKSLRDIERGMNTLYINDEIVKNQTGTWYLGVCAISNSISLKEYKTCSKNSLSNLQLDSDLKNINYSLRVYGGGCYYFNKLTEVWEGSGLKNLNLSRKESGCLASHLTSFASGFFYLKNTIDFELIFPLTSYSDNLTLFTFLAITCIAYLSALIYSIIMDRIDLKKINVPYMLDNHPNDTYMYEMIVETGPFPSSQAKCKVQFILFGENDTTEIRTLNNEERDLFRSGSFDYFLLTTNRPLGPLVRLLIWTDSMGFGDAGSWYLMSVTFMDIQNGVKTRFIGNRWLALDRGDFEETAILYPHSYGDPEDYKYLLRTSIFRFFKNHHIWLSIFLKPLTSRFSRVQRSTVCLTYYSLSMLLNAFYYMLSPQHLIDSLFTIEFIGFDFRDILTGFISSIIVTIPIILPVVLFTKSRHWKKRENRCKKGINEAINKKIFNIKVEGYQRKKNTLENQRNRSYHYIFWIISWIFCLLIICVSITLSIGFMLNFSNDVIYQFIVAMILNLFSSLFIVQPMIVTFLTFYYGLCKQSTHYFEDDHTEEDEEPPTIYFNPNDNISVDRRPRNLTPHRIVFDNNFKRRLKELRSTEFEMRLVIKELFIYFFYLSIVLIICFGSRDPNAHWEKKNIVINIVHGGANCEIYPKDDSRYRPCKEIRASTDFQKIKDINDWWKWVETTLIPNARVQPWYNGRPPYGFRGYLNDRVNRLIGYAIVRQVRQKIGVCRTHPFVREHIEECLGEGSISSEDTTHWCENWKPKHMEINCTAAPEYQYISATELESLPVSGKINTYSGGGYVLRLQGYIGDLQKRIKKLQQDNWTDNRTRGLLAEFSIYNAQINMFATVTCIAEFIGGGIQPYHRVDVFRLFPNKSFFSEVLKISEVLFVFATFYYTISILATLKKEGMRDFIKNFWNLTDFATVIFSFTAISLYIVRFIIVIETTKRISVTRGNEYIRLTIPALINSYYDYSISFIAFTTSLKLCKLFGFQKTFRQIGLTIKLCFQGLSTFLIEFCILFGAFCSFFYFVLMDDLEKFRDFLRSFENTLAMSIGKFNFSELRNANILAAWIFFAFSIAINMVLINMVMSIINLAFEEVKESKSISKNKFQLLQYAKNTSAQMIGLQNPKLIKPVYNLEKSDKVEEENHLSIKADILMNYLETEYSSMNLEQKKFVLKLKEKAKDGNEKKIGFDTFFNPDNSLN